jgi:hypothetical protein
MKIVMEYKEYNPEKEGFREVASEYKIKISRSDNGGLTKIEAETAMKIILEKKEISNQ